MTGATRGRFSTTWATRAFSTPFAIPSWRRIGSAISGATETGSGLAQRLSDGRLTATDARRGESINRVRKSSEPRAMVRDRRQFVVLPSGPLIPVSLPPAQGPHGHHSLHSLAHPELPENCGDV